MKIIWSNVELLETFHIFDDIQFKLISVKQYIEPLIDYSIGMDFAQFGVDPKFLTGKTGFFQRQDPSIVKDLKKMGLWQKYGSE